MSGGVEGKKTRTNTIPLVSVIWISIYHVSIYGALSTDWYSINSTQTAALPFKTVGHIYFARVLIDIKFLFWLGLAWAFRLFLTRAEFFDYGIAVTKAGVDDILLQSTAAY